MVKARYLPSARARGNTGGGRALRISREAGNPLKARLNNESRSRVRIGSETLPINPLPGGNPGRGETALSRLLKRLGLQLEKIVGGFARLRSGGKECALILL